MDWFVNLCFVFLIIKKFTCLKIVSVSHVFDFQKKNIVNNKKISAPYARHEKS